METYKDFGLINKNESNWTQPAKTELVNLWFTQIDIYLFISKGNFFPVLALFFSFSFFFIFYFLFLFIVCNCIRNLTIMIEKLTIMNVHIVPKKKCNARDTTNFITRYLQIDVALT